VPVAPPPIAAAAPPPIAAPVAPPPIVASPAADPFAAPTAEQAAKEAREHKRLPFEVNVTSMSEHNFFAGLSLNISEGGLFVSTHHRHPVGTQIELQLLFPGDDEPVTVQTEVRWIRVHNEGSDQGPGLGLKFVDLRPEVRSKINRFVRNRAPLFYDAD
jgi:uncharacterized protein (TIGR02266 family)